MRRWHAVVVAVLLVAGVVTLPAVAATFTVTSVADTGAGTLRSAINNANTNVGADTINFGAGMAGKTIHLQSDLPTLSDAATSIDGDINADGKPDVAIAGDVAAINNGLTITSAGNTLNGLCINSCAYGIYLSGSSAQNNLITSCYVGTNLLGTLPLPNDNYGIYVYYGSNNTIGGLTATTRNVISGNYNHGVYLYKARGTQVRDAYIGLNAAGTARIPNAGNGIYAYNCPGLTIGAADAAAKTVLSGNNNGGASLYYCANARVLNCYVGTNPAGTAIQANNGNGLYLYTCNSIRIGGTAVLQPNVISGNNGNGIYANNTFSGPIILGNKIGTNAAGSATLPNSSSGVQLYYCSDTVIGDATSAGRNLISGNSNAGVYMDSCTGTTIKGNYVGVGSNGLLDLRNDGDGVTASNCGTLSVGGTTTAERNVVCADQTGIRLTGSRSSADNVINNYVGYGVDGTTALPGAQGIVVQYGVRSSNIGAAGKGNRILATGSGLQFSRVGFGVQAIGNRIGAPLGTTAYGNYGLYLTNCSPTINSNSVFQQTYYGIYIEGVFSLPVIKNSVFRNNGTGCYIANDAQPDLGDLGNIATTDDGNNTFTGATGYEIYNQSIYDIKAEGNTFNTTSAATIDANLIYDQLDDASVGRVDYDPLKSGAPTPIAALGMTVAAAPTRAGGAQIVISLSGAGDLSAEVMNVAGRGVRQWSGLRGKSGANTLLWDGKAASGLAVPSGPYLIAVTCRSGDGQQQRQLARVQLAR